MDTLKTDALIQAIRNRAEQNRAKVSRDPAVQASYARKAAECDQEARDIECRQLLTAVQEDPFAKAMQAAGCTEHVLGRTNKAENGLKRAPRSVVRAGWPHQDIAAEPAQPSRWPF